MSLWGLRRRKSHQSARRKASSQDEKVEPPKNNHRSPNAVHYFVSVKITPWLLQSTNTGRMSNWILLLQTPLMHQSSETHSNEWQFPNESFHSLLEGYLKNELQNKPTPPVYGSSFQMSFLSLVSISIWAACWLGLHVETAASLHMSLKAHVFITGMLLCWSGVPLAQMHYVSLADITGTGLHWYWVVPLRTTFIPVCLLLPPRGVCARHQTRRTGCWMRSKWPVNGFGPAPPRPREGDTHKSSKNYPEKAR